MTLTLGCACNRNGYAKCGALTPPNIFPGFRREVASTIKRFASSLCILLTLTVLLVPVQSFGYQNEVDWMWNDTKPTSKAEPVNDFETLSRPSMSLFEKGERPLL